jgi:hypothetical protein
MWFSPEEYVVKKKPSDIAGGAMEVRRPGVQI